MRASRRLLLGVLIALIVGSDQRAAGDAGDPGQARGRSSDRSDSRARSAALTPALKGRILTAMRLNRRAFQEDAVLARYGERRPPITHPALVSCELPRTSGGAPAANYPAAVARSTPRPYTEAAVADCLSTTGGLSGTRASPLAQHYYCSLPGLSPDIRGCFTFQLRLPRVSRTRAAWEEGFLPDGTKLPLEKGWNFLGPDRTQVPDVGTAFTYCATDGRPHSINTLKNGKPAPLKVAQVHPTPTRPMCWIVETQADIFQRIMSGTIDVPMRDQVALLREYYDCGAIEGKVSDARFQALCGFDSGR